MAGVRVTHRWKVTTRPDARSSPSTKSTTTTTSAPPAGPRSGPTAETGRGYARCGPGPAPLCFGAARTASPLMPRAEIKNAAAITRDARAPKGPGESRGPWPWRVLWSRRRRSSHQGGLNPGRRQKHLPKTSSQPSYDRSPHTRELVSHFANTARRRRRRGRWRLVVDDGVARAVRCSAHERFNLSTVVSSFRGHDGRMQWPCSGR